MTALPPALYLRCSLLLSFAFDQLYPQNLPFMIHFRATVQAEDRTITTLAAARNRIQLETAD